MTTQEAAEYLSVTYDWLKRQVAANLVPHTKLGKFVRFTPEHLDQIVSAGERGPASPSMKRGSARTRL
jgi:excisionase family DNA binding protein